MKTAALLVLAVTASPLGQAASSSGNSTEGVATPHGGGNTSAIGLQVEQEWFCTPPKGGVDYFWRLTKNEGPFRYTKYPLLVEWSMLRSYRDGGIQNVHWKYTDNENDPECMQRWSYHAADGRTLKAYVPGRTTTFGLGRRWCGLPVYNDGGVQGFQWDYADCGWADPIYP